MSKPKRSKKPRSENGHHYWPGWSPPKPEPVDELTPIYAQVVNDLGFDPARTVWPVYPQPGDEGWYDWWASRASANAKESTASSSQ